MPSLSLSLSLVLRYVFVLTFFILLNSKETFSSRLVRSPATVAEIGADDYPSTGRNTPVHDLGFPDFPSFQEATVTPPPDLPLIPPSPPDLPILPPSLPYLPLLPPPPPYLPLLPPPPPNMPLLPPPPPYLPLLPPPPPDMPLLPPPPPPPQPFPGLEGPPRVPVPVWPSLPEAMPFPFIDQPPPSEPFGPRFDEFGNVMPSTPSNPLGLP